MKIKVVYLIAVLALIFSVAAAIVPATPVEAETPPTFTVTLVLTGNSSSARWPVPLQSGDKVVQFRRDNAVLQSNVNATFTVSAPGSGNMTGDLSGTISTQAANILNIPVPVPYPSASTYTGFGLAIARGTFSSSSPSGSFEAIGVQDYNYVWSPDEGGRSDLTVYWISVKESECFAGQKLIGTGHMTSSSPPGGGAATTTGVLTFRRYLASEITRLAPDTTFTGTYTPGIYRSIPTLGNDTLFKVTETPPYNYYTPTEGHTFFEDGSSFTNLNITSGPFFNGTMSKSDNSFSYQFGSTVLGWGVSTGNIITEAGNISCIMLTDLSSPTAQSGYIFSKWQDNSGAYENKDYFATTSATVSYPDLSINGSAIFYELSAPVSASKTEPTLPGNYTVDAKAEADTEVTKSGSGTPTITVANYSSNPGGSLQDDIGKYIDVFVPDSTNVDQIEIKLYYTHAEIAGVDESSLRLYWLNGSSWEQCSDSGVDAGADYIWAKLRPDTTPDLSYLGGGPFAGGGGVPAATCFIATAAYGTPMAEEVDVLRDFRDQYLLTNPVGKALVELYYKVSPPMAEFITEHPALKPIVRVVLMPAVVMSTMAVNTTSAGKMAILGSLALVCIALAIWVRERARRLGRGR